MRLPSSLSMNPESRWRFFSFTTLSSFQAYCKPIYYLHTCNWSMVSYCNNAVSWHTTYDSHLYDKLAYAVRHSVRFPSFIRKMTLITVPPFLQPAYNWRTKNVRARMNITVISIVSAYEQKSRTHTSRTNIYYQLHLHLIISFIANYNQLHRIHIPYLQEKYNKTFKDNIITITITHDRSRIQFVRTLLEIHTWYVFPYVSCKRVTVDSPREGYSSCH